MRYFTPTPNPARHLFGGHPIKREGLICDTFEAKMMLGNILPHDKSSITLEHSPSLILGEGAGGWGL